MESSNVVKDPSWREAAQCKAPDIDPKIFFPVDGAGVIAAKEICRNCVVRGECLEYALAIREGHGVWGGASERERRRILRQRRVSVEYTPQS